MFLVVTIPDAAVPAALTAAFGALGLTIRTLYSDSKAETIRARTERESMLGAMERLTDAVTKLSAERQP